MAANFKWYLQWGTKHFAAKCTRGCYPEPLPGGTRGQLWPIVRFERLARDTARGNGEHRRGRARQATALVSFDADERCEADRSDAASLGSPETTWTTMAHGGVRYRKHDGDKCRARRRLGTETRGESGQERAQTHPSCVRMIGDDGEGRRRRQSTKTSGRGSYGKMVMAVRRRRSSTQDSASK